jgi:hypothetical protein
MSDLNLDNSDLASITENTLGPIEKKINQFSLKAAGEGWKAFKRILGTITEPFFRMGMGERYYQYGAFAVGVVIWIGAGLASSQFAPQASIAAILTHCRPFHFLAFIFQSTAFPIVVGLLMAFVQARVGLRNIREALRFQREGIIHHSYSRGAPVWRNEGLAFLMIEAVLWMFNWPIAVLFTAGYSMNSMLKSKQDAAIRERYLDAVDKDIEQKYLKDSALGNCPPEMTFLYHQLDPNIKPEVREKMAAALVGESVSVVAKPPQKKQPASQPPNIETPPKPEAPESELGKMAGQNRGGLFAVSPISQEEFTKLWNLGLRFRRFIVLGLMIVIGLLVVMAFSHFIQSHWKRSAVASAAMPVSKQPAAAVPVTAPAQTPRAVETPVASAPDIKPAESSAPAVAATPESQDQEQIIAQINSVLTNEIAKVAAFKTTTDNFLGNEKLKINNAPSSYQNFLMEDFTRDQKSVAEVIELQKKALGKVPQRLQTVLDTKSEDPQLFLEKFNAFTPKMEAARKQASKLLDKLDAEIAKTSNN